MQEHINNGVGGAKMKAFWLLVWLPVVLGGCATPVRPPTPASEIRFQDLDVEPPPPGERYYLLVFASQTTPVVPRKTHSWATVVRVSGCQSGESPQIEEQSISWMPATMEIHPWRFRVEPGVNLDLRQSLNNALLNRERISLWGPYELRPGAYRKFLLQREFMLSGQVGYQCVDSVGEASKKGNGCDCIHAITDLDALFDRKEYPLSKFGDAASQHIAKQIVDRGAIINPAQIHDWLIPVLGLDRYNIVRRAVTSRRLGSRRE